MVASFWEVALIVLAAIIVGISIVCSGVLIGGAIFASAQRIAAAIELAAAFERDQPIQDGEHNNYYFN